MAMAESGEAVLSKYRREREAVSKGDLVARLRELLKGDRISWFMADGRFFDWGEVNLGKERFIDEVRMTDFGTALMSVHVPGEGSEYTAFRITG